MAHPRFHLRFFFDAGSGTCLWSASDDARERYGYAISNSELPVDEDLRRTANHLCAWYDTSLDWRDPGGRSPWDAEETRRFEVAAARFVVRLRDALGPDFLVSDEFARQESGSSAAERLSVRQMLEGWGDRWRQSVARTLTSLGLLWFALLVPEWWHFLVLRDFSRAADYPFGTEQGWSYSNPVVYAWSSLVLGVAIVAIAVLLHVALVRRSWRAVGCAAALVVLWCVADQMLGV